jgi:hypothetical protein
MTLRLDTRSGRGMPIAPCWVIVGRISGAQEEG